MFDGNGDGKISIEELGTVLSSLEESLSEAFLMFRDVDVDGDGAIDLEEFISFNSDRGAASVSVADLVEALQSPFDAFDRDKDGFISARELHRVLSGLPGDGPVFVKDCRHMISCVDAGDDDRIDFQEFHKLMTGLLRGSSLENMALGTVLFWLGEGLSEGELEQMTRDVNAHGDGVIDFISLNSDRGTASVSGADVAEALQSEFDVFDSVKDWFISAPELHRVL